MDTRTVSQIDLYSWLVEQVEDDPAVLYRILWTDEAKFINNGVINNQYIYFCRMAAHIRPDQD